MKTYTACIIGAGSIGALKPSHIDFLGSENILTHGNALCRHTRTALLGICDTNKDKAKQASTKWRCRPFTDIHEMFRMLDPDIVVVAVPTEHHYDIFMDLTDRPTHPKLIIAEKPFCQYLHQALTIHSLWEDMNISITVDYIRRFSKGHQDIKKQIDEGVWGKALNCRVLYTKGLRHEGCHAIDLMRYFFGECVYGKISHAYPIDDRDNNDLTFEANFSFENCGSVIFQPCDGRKYGIFEIDICFENVRIRLIDNGLFAEFYPINSENEWGHKSLAYGLTSVIRTETGLNTALYNLVDNAVNFLDGKEELICAAEDAVKVHEVLEGLK